MKKYHDEEWGTPIHDDIKLFEALTMESMQCGLSWDIIFNKREVLNKCFDNFDYEKISKYNNDDIDRIINTDRMIKSKNKIESVINNAKCFILVRNEFKTFDNYIWKFTNYKTILYKGHENGNIPSSNHLSDIISKDMKKRGFKYIGSTIIYAYLQAIGIINDHNVNCKRYKELLNENCIFKNRYGEK